MPLLPRESAPQPVGKSSTPAIQVSFCPGHGSYPGWRHTSRNGRAECPKSARCGH